MAALSRSRSRRISILGVLPIRPLFSVGLFDGVFPGRAIIAEATLGILLGRGRPSRRLWHGILQWFLWTKTGLIARWNRSCTAFMFLGHEFLLANEWDKAAKQLRWRDQRFVLRCPTGKRRLQISNLQGFTIPRRSNSCASDMPNN